MATFGRDIDPSERPLALDPRRPAARGNPAPVSLIVSVLVLAALGGGVFWLYRGGARTPSGPPAPVGVPIRDVRVAAPPQPVQQDPAAGLTVYTDDPGAQNAVPVWAPAPEQPGPRPQTVAPTPAVAAPPPGKAPVAAAMAASHAPSPALYPVAPAAHPTSIDEVLADASAKPGAAPRAKASAAPAPPTKNSAKTVDKPGAFAVQIGAFSSESMADRSWTSAAVLAPGDMAGKGKRIASVSRGGATLYRVAVTGFETHASAEALCARLKAAGRTCFVR